MCVCVAEVQARHAPRASLLSVQKLHPAKLAARCQAPRNAWHALSFKKRNCVHAVGLGAYRKPFEFYSSLEKANILRLLGGLNVLRDALQKVLVLLETTVVPTPRPFPLCIVSEPKEWH